MNIISPEIEQSHLDGRQIIKALIAGDSSRAADLMEDHMEQVAGRALLKTRKSLSLQDVLATYASRFAPR